MCKATHNSGGSDGDRTGCGGNRSGALQRSLRHLKRGGASDAGTDSNDETESPSSRIPTILRLLSSDVLTEVCCLLDAKSLATAAAVCRGMRDACQVSYPWRLLCSREWGLLRATEEEDGRGSCVSDERRQHEQQPRRARPEFRDSILGLDFRKVFPLIEPMPTGFDCSKLRPRSSRLGPQAPQPPPAAAAAADNNNNNDNAAVVEAAAPAAEAAANGDEAQEGGAAGGAEAAAAAAVAVDDVVGGDQGRNGDVQGGEAGDGTWEEDVGGFWVRRMRSPKEGEVLPGSGKEADLAMQVEYHGPLGVGNRCVRADIPLPSTVLRERKGVGAKSHLARHLASSPIALFRRLLFKMASTAAGTAGRRRPRLRLIGHSASSAGHEGVVGGQGGGGVHAAGAGISFETSVPAEQERSQRSVSEPLSASGREQQQQQQPLLRPFCFPVSLGSGMVDVTPRLVSYFEVSIGHPRNDPARPIPDCVAVGLTKEKFPLVGKMPGWDALSYGYHSDDGGAFHDAGSMLFKCGPSFGAGDVVGCGLDYSGGDDSADIFFTLNGRSLGDAFHGVRGSLYPTVGVDSACPVKINVGREPFVFDLAAALKEGGQESAACQAIGLSESACMADSTAAVAPASNPRFSYSSDSKRPSERVTGAPAVLLRPFGSSSANQMVAPTY